MALNIARGFKRLFGKASQTLGPSKFLFGQFPDEFTKGAFRDPYEQHSVVFSVVSANAQKAASVPFKLYRSGGENAAPIERRWTEKAYALHRGLERAREALDPRRRVSQRAKAAENLEQITAGPWFELFNRPNPNLYGRSQLWEITVSKILVFGEELWVLMGKNGRLAPGEMPTEIWPVKPTRMKHHVDSATKLIDYWEIQDERSGETIRFLPHEVVHFKTGLDLYRGQPPLRSMNLDLTADFHAKAFNLARFMNDGFVGGVIQSKGVIEDEDRQRMRAEFGEMHAGLGKNNRLLIIDGDAEYRPNEITNQDLQFLEGMQFNKEGVCGVYHTPKFVISHTEDLNLALAEASRKQWISGTILPLLHMIEDTLLFGLFARVTAEREVGLFDAAEIPELQESATEKIEPLQGMLRSGITLRAANERLNLGLTEEQLGPTADVAFIGTDLIPVGEAIDAAKDAEEEPREPDEDEPEIEGEDQEPEPKAAPRSLGADANAREALWRAKDARIIRPNEAAFRGKVQKWLYEMRVAQLRKLEEVIGKGIGEGSGKGIGKGFPEALTRDLLKPEQIERAMLDLEEWAEKGYQKLLKSYKKSMRDASEDAAEMAKLEDFTFDDESPLVRRILEARRIQFRGITDDVQKSIRRVLAESLSRAESARETADRVRAKFNEMSLGRANTIARTENASAQEGARQIVFDEAEVPYVRWITSRDNFVRESHKIDGQTQPRGTPFQLKGGGEIGYPLDPTAPAGEVVNCRCLTVPIFRK